jgi:survival of motor neuron-related-splicing factor 30
MEDLEHQLAEYESQLDDVQLLLEATPEDDSLLSLKKDLEELVGLTRSSLLEQQEQQQEQTTTVLLAGSTFSNEHDEEDETGEKQVAQGFVSLDANQIDASFPANTTATTATTHGVVKPATTITTKKSSSTKKDKSLLEDAEAAFEVPTHLIVLETDTEVERNKKRRTVKALKSKWREKKKDAESRLKQKSWQSFQKKTSKSNNHSKRESSELESSTGGAAASSISNTTSSSIFSTQPGSVHDRVGVISKKQMTNFDTRKRHKY